MDLGVGLGFINTEGAVFVSGYNEEPAMSGYIGFLASLFSKKYEGLYTSAGLNFSSISAVFRFNEDRDYFDLQTNSEISNIKNEISSLQLGIPILVGYETNKFSLETGVETSYNFRQQLSYSHLETSEGNKKLVMYESISM